MATYHLSVKVGKRGNGGAHAEYVSRSGAYENYRNGEDLVHTESINMPGWAAHDPAEFFRQADIHERANGSAYREFEVALPRELTPEQRIELVRDFVRQEIGDRHPCTWAIHNPSAAIDGDEQPHAHIMFSDRQLDGIERDPEQFFKRANSKAPEKGGCKKANAPATSAERKAALVALRGRWADLQNAHLAIDAHPSRVTHLSLKDQGLDRQPEKHLGPQRARQAEHTDRIKQRRDALDRVAMTQDEAQQINPAKALKEQRHEQRREQQRTRNRQRNARARITEVQQLRGIDDLPTRDDQVRLLPGDERHHLDERQARQAADRVQQLEQARAVAAQAAANQERRREERRGAWQAKHYPTPSLSRGGAAPTPGKPQVWRTAKGIPLVVDYGNRIKATGKPEKAAGKAEALVSVAKKKGWSAITITGPDDFKLAVAAQALKQGVALVDKDLQVRAERQQQAQEATRKAREAQPKATLPSTPAPSPKAPPEAAQKAPREESPQEFAQRLAREAREKEAAAFEKAMAPAPGVTPIRQVMQEHDEASKAVAELTGELRKQAEYPDTHLKKGWENEAWSLAEAQVDAEWRQANPKGEDPRHWEWRKDAAAKALQEHQAQPRPLLFTGDYDRKTKELQGAVASFEKALKQRQDKAFPVAKTLYEQKVAEHAAKEAKKAEQRRQIEKKLDPLVKRRDALGAQLDARKDEVQAIHRSTKQQRALERQLQGKSQSRGIGD